MLPGKIVPDPPAKVPAQIKTLIILIRLPNSFGMIHQEAYGTS